MIQIQPASTATKATSYVDSYQPPEAEQTAKIKSTKTPPSPKPSVATSPPTVSDSQALKEQNIFFLLGADAGTEAEKKAFLDELQQVVWEDFIDHEAQALISAEEKVGLEKIQAQSGSEETKQGKVIAYLEKLIPNLEELVLEKALLLKADLVKERLASMREHYAAQAEVLAQLNEAEALINQDQWHHAAQVLNQIG